MGEKGSKGKFSFKESRAFYGKIYRRRRNNVENSMDVSEEKRKREHVVGITGSMVKIG